MPSHNSPAMVQAVEAVQNADARLRAEYTVGLGEWLVQQGTAREAGKEVLLQAAALLDFTSPPAVHGELFSTTMICMLYAANPSSLCASTL